MGYVDNQLNTGERVVARAKYHWANFFHDLICLAIFIAIIVWFTENIFQEHVFDLILAGIESLTDIGKSRAFFESMNEELLVALAIFILLLIFIIYYSLHLIMSFIKLSSQPLVLTNHRILGKIGIFYRDALDTPISKVDTIRIRKGTIGLIFNYGSIHILTNTGKYIYNGIARPEDFKNDVFMVISHP